jgi:hypothetical protein
VDATSPPAEARVEAPPAATDAGRVAVSGRLYTHPLGYRFRYPERWTLQPAGDDVLALVPPDAKRLEQGLAELYLALGAPADGVGAPDDPALLARVDQLVRSSFPFLSRQGETVTGRHGGRPSATVTWAGKSPVLGDCRAVMWITILKDAALGLAAIGPGADVEARRPVLEAIFSTFHYEAPPRDPALAGRWRNESTYMSGEFSATTVRYMGLSAEGRATWGSQANFGMSHTDSTGQFTGSSSGDASGDTSTGRWSAAQKRLYIVWDSGTEEEYEYYVEGSSMMLTPIGGGKRKVWERIR